MALDREEVGPGLHLPVPVEQCPPLAFGHAAPDTELNLGVAVDSAGNVYITDSSKNRVLELPAGSSTQVELSFTGLNNPWGVAVDTAGNVYVADNSKNNGRLLELAAGLSTQVELPFTGVNTPSGVAVDTAGVVYVSDYTNNRVLELAAGSTTPVELPFTGLNNPWGGWRWTPPATSTSATAITGC
jgi:DNA-binding beta-propeller fold protein YncE